MSSIDKNKDGGEEGSSHNTPHAITITIMDTSSMEATTFRPPGLSSTTFRPTIVSSRETQDTREDSGSLLVVSGNDDSTISVSQSAKDLLQTVTETHMGSEELPVISNINSSEDVCGQSTIQIVTKADDIEIDKADEAEESEGGGEMSAYLCLICNEELHEEQIPVFKTLTTTSQRKVSVYLGILVGQKLTSRKAHSDIICPKCFSLLNRLDLLEVEIHDTREELVRKYQQTVAIHGGRARRRKSAAAKKSDFVFPKIEPDDEDEQAISLEMDETFEPRVDDLLEEEHDRREDRDSQDEEWEPEYKRARTKREASETDPRGPLKRKRGRPRKDAAKSKGEQLQRNNQPGSTSPPSTRRIVTVPAIFKKCPHCTTIFMDNAQLVAHLAKQHKKHQEERHCHRCRRRFLTYEDNTACDPCLQSLRLNALPCRKSSEECMESNIVNTFLCSHCNLTFDSRVLVELHCLSTGHNMDNISNISDKISDKPLKSSVQSLSGKQDPSSVKDISANRIKKESKGWVRGTKRERKRRLIKKNQTVCEVCSLEFGSVSSLYAHLHASHPELFPHECRVCKRRFSLEASAKEHERRHAMGDLQCPACPLRFSHISHLHQHARNHHPDFTDFRCQYCDAVTPTVDALQSHIKVRHGDQLGLPAAFTCKICKETFHTGKALATHRSNRHPGNAECGICGARVGSRYLKKHINAVHTKEKVHKCNECGTEFYSRTSLTGHQRRHHGPRKFFCHLCGKGYVHNVELQRHLKAHRNERDFKCEFCSRSFLKAVDLTYHRRSHTGERPHQCDLCQESFVRPLGLRKHMLKHSSIKKGKRLKYSKKKIDELTSSVMNQNSEELNIASEPSECAGLSTLETSALVPTSPSMTQPLQSFPDSGVITQALPQSQHRLQSSVHQLASHELQVQQLSVTDLDSSQLEGQLELSQVVEDLNSGELLEMSPGLLLEATDVQETDGAIVGSVTSCADVQSEVGQSSQPVQVIYVVENILNPTICYHKSLENCSKCKSDNYGNYF